MLYNILQGLKNVIIAVLASYNQIGVISSYVYLDFVACLKRSNIETEKSKIKETEKM